MSMIASGSVVSASVLPGLLAATGRKPRLFGFGGPTFEQLLEKGRTLPSFDSAGHVLATLLVFLQQQGIDLLDGELAPMSERMSAARGSSIVLLTDTHRKAQLP